MRATEVYRLLRSSSVGFVVVTTLEQDPFSEAEFFCNELHEFSMPLRGIVANRTLPDYLCDPAAASAALALSEDETISGWLSDELGHRVTNDAARRLGETFLVFHRLARRDAAQLDRLSRLTKRVPVARIPLMTEEVGDLEGLARVARYL